MATYRTKISSKGQVVIPVELREQLGLKNGTRATWSEEEGHLVLTPISEQQINKLMGSLKPKPGEPTMFDDLFREHERERQREKQ